MSAERRMPSREEISLCAHDLRGALTVIAGYTGLLRRGDLDAAERTAALAGIDTAISRIDALIGDTLAGTQVPRTRFTRFDLVELGARAAADAHAAFGRIVMLAASERVYVEGDDVALARVLENLLSNAAKYAPHGDIDVTIRYSDDRAVVEVADRGPGVPPGERSTIFEPFVRSNADPDTPGTGLGLTVVRSVAERHGGTVTVDEREGGGTVVRVELPASR